MGRTVIALLSLLLLGSASEQARDTDWRGDGKLTVVGDQASCNGCVAFSLTGALEWYVSDLTGQLTPLSVQYLIDCGIDEYTGLEENGCSGGKVNVEVDEIMSTQYVPYAADYTYKSNFLPGRCDDYHAREKLLRNALADVWVYTYKPISQTTEALRKALEHGPAIVNLNISPEFQEWKDDKIHDDETCVVNPMPHSMTFVGWQSNNGNPYYIARNSYGDNFGVHGYIKYADSVINQSCGFTTSTYSIAVGRRRELEYKLGEGLKTFPDARQWCQDQGEGWDLAHIPTQMHNLEVYDLLTSTYGDDKKNDDKFNYVWIGLARPGENWVWVEGDADAPITQITGIEAQYLRFKNKDDTPRFVVMDRVNRGEHRARGTWTVAARGQTYRFVCSRYRNEACPRISHTAVENAYSVTFYNKRKELTQDIDEGTNAKVCCMTGFKPSSSKPGKCKGGKWKQMPSCKKDKKSDVEDLTEIELNEETLENCTDYEL